MGVMVVAVLVMMIIVIVVMMITVVGKGIRMMMIERKTDKSWNNDIQNEVTMIKQDEDEKGNGDFEDSNGNPNHNNVKKKYIIYIW